jgi:hypothetical protein
MRRMIGWLFAVVGFVGAFASAWAQDAARPGDKVMTPASLRAEIEALKPARLAWHGITWQSCLLEGLREAREKNKPVLLWAFGNGDPAEKRC